MLYIFGLKMGQERIKKRRREAITTIKKNKKIFSSFKCFYGKKKF
jgi:hypothetical protein